MIVNEGEWCLVVVSGVEWLVMIGNDGFLVMFVIVYVEVWEEVV